MVVFRRVGTVDLGEIDLEGDKGVGPKGEYDYDEGGDKPCGARTGNVRCLYCSILRKYIQWKVFVTGHTMQVTATVTRM